jgi:hypothetical protein
MWEEISPAIILAVIFGSFVLLIKVISDNRIRREIIASGKVDENLKYLFIKNGSYVKSPINSMKWGLVCIAVGTSIVAGQLLPYRISDDVTFGLIFLLSGIALLIYYSVAQRKIAENKQEK